MLLKNLVKYLTLFPNFGGQWTTVSCINEAGTTITNSGNNNNYVMPLYSGYTSGSTAYYLWPNGKGVGGGNGTSNYTNFGILLGEGDTAPTMDDKSIETINTSLTPLAYPSIQLDRTQGLFRTLQTVRNDTANAITIKELGLAAGACNSSSPYNMLHYILFTREVLDAPVTIQPGETYTFVVEVNMFTFSDGYSRPQAVS